jgi:Na+/proline symporter
VTLLLKDSGIGFHTAVTGVGVLMIVYVVFGGMLATTWVQIVKAVLLMGGTLLLSILVVAHFGGSFGRFFDAVTRVTYHDANGAEITQNFLQPGLRFKPPYGPLDLVSLGLALIFGTAGLPHILVRFYTVPDAKTARVSVVWAMILIGAFYIMTTFLGFGAATIVGRDKIAVRGGVNMSAPLLAQALGGDIFFAFISAIAFATILAVVAGLTISASASFAHDFWANVVITALNAVQEKRCWLLASLPLVVGAVAILIRFCRGRRLMWRFWLGWLLPLPLQPICLILLSLILETLQYNRWSWAWEQVWFLRLRSSSSAPASWESTLPAASAATPFSRNHSFPWRTRASSAFRSGFSAPFWARCSGGNQKPSESLPNCQSGPTLGSDRKKQRSIESPCLIRRKNTKTSL